MSRMRKYRSFRFPTDFSTLMPEFSENFGLSELPGKCTRCKHCNGICRRL